MINSKAVFNIKTDAQFNRIALDIFKFQFENNAVYRSFCDLLNKHPSDVKTIEDIPFLPIQLFKTHDILSSTDTVQKIFRSSGTSGSNTSKHLITDPKLYKECFSKGFQHFYGNIKNYVILGLLPSYLEREDSSLVYMVNDLIVQSEQPESGFYMNNFLELKDVLTRIDKEKKALLIGVSFALLDLIELYQFQLDNTIIMETGGMKGRRKELIRKDLHQQLKAGFGVDTIHSEYGMTELLSQAYSNGESLFKTPPWMKVLIRDTEDALSLISNERTGGVNIIDLANINSCAFVATQDLGKTYSDGSFEILGRFDQSDIRGCNLMAI